MEGDNVRRPAWKEPHSIQRGHDTDLQLQQTKITSTTDGPLSWVSFERDKTN
jgi:hypothetical protein